MTKESKTWTKLDHASRKLYQLARGMVVVFKRS